MSKPFSRQGEYCAVDNDAFDVIMPHISPAAWKVLSLVIRKTVGWRKDSDLISYSQIKRLCGRGLSSQATVAMVLSELARLEIITVTTDGPRGTARYGLNRGFDTESLTTSSKNGLVQKMNRFKKRTSTSSENEHTKNTIQKTEEGDLRRSPAPATPDALPAAPVLNGATKNGATKPRAGTQSEWREFNDAWLTSFNLPESVSNLKLASKCKGVLTHHGVPANEAAETWGYFWGWAKDTKETKYVRSYNAYDYLARFLKDE